MARARAVDVRMLAGCRGRVPAAEVRRIARAVLDAEGVPADVGVSVVLADAATARELNRLYRGRDESADVLSFADHEGGPFLDAPGAPASLGEVVICLPLAAEQAAAAGRPVAGEVAHLLAHGLLHLLGDDHETASEAEAMRAREDSLLAALGYAEAYEHGH